MHGNALLRARSRQRARGYRRGSNLRSTAGRTAVHPGTSFPHDAELLAASNLFALSCVSAGYAIPQQDELGDGTEKLSSKRERVEAKRVLAVRGHRQTLRSRTRSKPGWTWVHCQAWRDPRDG